ncbi:T9SS type A sorting domain-containing protein [Polluticoccus soli]|uniref:T9SS type A sorting domain-containing protein n=1 Tax=Polluticoccus soli TaxID=3034150 RepID=UPI0023E34AC2|nr:T9SS type A sorting domain-containing protein [Flavipsychrobacter sp. JY13-12]
MIRLILFIVFLIGTQAPAAFAQHMIDGDPGDSTTFTFEINDSLIRTKHVESIDTTGALLWKIGTTSKAFFSGGKTSDYAIMTDTSNFYPINANDAFVLKFQQGGFFNMIIGFWHKYQTTSKHDGGVVEYSTDGFNWLNLLDSCNADTMFWMESGITTENFYSRNDTLLNGTPAFNGTSNGWQYSRFQFFYGLPVKGTSYPCLPTDSAFVRFRFISDDTVESLDGWIIDNIKIERDMYSAVKDIKQSGDITVYPNPTINEILIYADEKRYTNGVLINALGQIVKRVPIYDSRTKINIKELPPGTYVLQLRGPEAIAVERILKQ